MLSQKYIFIRNAVKFMLQMLFCKGLRNFKALACLFVGHHNQ